MEKMGGGLVGVAGGALPGSVGSEGQRWTPKEQQSQTPVQFVNGGELSVLFGDGTPHGMGLPGYCGIWSLGSVRDVHNAFVNSYGGFLFGSHRGRPVELRRVSERQVLYLLKEPHLHSRVLFTVREPYYVDSETTIIPQVQVAAPHLLQAWYSYINSPEDDGIHLWHDGRWITVHSPQHGVEATYCPTSLKNTKDDLRHVSSEERSRFFYYAYSEQRFSKPLFLGRIRHMVMAFLFDTFENIRFTISPSGGGASILPGRNCPAWDWLWLVPQPRPGTPYTLRVRMVYKQFAGRNDMLDELARWGAERQTGGSS
jgi:hypothetical protein